MRWISEGTVALDLYNWNVNLVNIGASQTLAADYYTLEGPLTVLGALAEYAIIKRLVRLHKPVTTDAKESD